MRGFFRNPVSAGGISGGYDRISRPLSCRGRAEMHAEAFAEH